MPLCFNSKRIRSEPKYCKGNVYKQKRSKKLLTVIAFLSPFFAINLHIVTPDYLLRDINAFWGATLKENDQERTAIIFVTTERFRSTA